MISNWSLIFLNTPKNYTFLFNEINSNSNCRSLLGPSPKYGVRFYSSPSSSQPDPEFYTPEKKSFCITFDKDTIFVEEWFEQEVVKYLNPSTFYFVHAYVNYKENVIKKNLSAPLQLMFPYKIYAFKGRISYLYERLTYVQIQYLQDTYGVQAHMINHITVYFSVADDNLVNELPCSNNLDLERDMRFQQ